MFAWLPRFLPILGYIMSDRFCCNANVLFLSPENRYTFIFARLHWIYASGILIFHANLNWNDARVKSALVLFRWGSWYHNCWFLSPIFILWHETQKKTAASFLPRRVFLLCNKAWSTFPWRGHWGAGSSLRYETFNPDKLSSTKYD